MQHKERNGCEDHHREHALPNQTQASIEIQIPVAACEHVEDDLNEKRGDSDPAKDDTKVELPREKLEEAEGHEEDEGPGEIGVLVDDRVYTNWIQDGGGFEPDQPRVDAEFFEERGFLFKGGQGVGGGDGGGEGGH